MRRTIAAVLLAWACVATGCDSGPSRADIEAGGYVQTPLTGKELLRVAQDYALAANHQFVMLPRQIDDSSLPESEKVRLRQRIDYLQTVVLESRALASSYWRNDYSEADRRRVFRAVCDRIAQVSQERLELALRLQTLSQPDSESP